MEKLGIDARILIAQVINFIVLVVLFKKFIFKPFFEKLNSEEKRSKDELKKIKAYEEKEKELYTQKLELEKDYEKKLKTMYAKMKKETEEAKHEILKTAQQEADEIRKHNMDLIESEKAKGSEEIKKAAYTLAATLTEKVLSETVSADMQRKIVQEVTAKLPKISA